MLTKTDFGYYLEKFSELLETINKFSYQFIKDSSFASEQCRAAKKLYKAFEENFSDKSINIGWHHNEIYEIEEYISKRKLEDAKNRLIDNIESSISYFTPL